MNVRWERAFAFAEVAEALGIETRDVLAVFQTEEGNHGVLFTRDYANANSRVLEARLTSDADEILRASDERETEFTVGSLFKPRT